MAEVRLSIASREYIVTCEDGEEQRLQTLGTMVDDMARQAGGPSGALNESRLLLFSALLLADKLHDSSNGNLPTSTTAPKEVDATNSETARTLENLADRLESLADKLEK